MKRRDFLSTGALLSTAAMVPSFLWSMSGTRIQRSRTGKTLVVVQFSGGNDGLNTVVPYTNDLYYKNRPGLAIPAKEVVTLNNEQGLNPALQPLQNLYENSQLSILNGVGYPNPDRSHFRSMDIWHTGSSSDEYLSTGWLGRYLDNQCTGYDTPHHMLEVDDTLSLALKGKKSNGFAMSNPQQLQKAVGNPYLKKIADESVVNNHSENDVAYLYKTLIDTQSSARFLAEKARTHRSTQTYPNSPFGQDLKLIAQLMTADSDTKIYYVSLTGFDTHANQRNTQDRLLRQYAEGMDAFVKDLKQNGLLNDTLIMTFSEFGRRVAQNASGGTDHGTANNVFLLGGSLHKPGFYNQAPNLQALDNGDLKYQIDFRSIYAGILDQWLETNPSDILDKSVKKMMI